MNFRIANFNVENLILPDIRFYDRMILTREEYEAKVNWSAGIINRVQPDIIGVQELWTSEALADLVARSFHFPQGAHICAPGASAAWRTTRVRRASSIWIRPLPIRLWMPGWPDSSMTVRDVLRSTAFRVSAVQVGRA